MITTKQCIQSNSNGGEHLVNFDIAEIILILVNITFFPFLFITRLYIKFFI